jgi:hypothetical protein
MKVDSSKTYLNYSLKRSWLKDGKQKDKAFYY